MSEPESGHSAEFCNIAATLQGHFIMVTAATQTDRKREKVEYTSLTWSLSVEELTLYNSLEL